MKELSWLGFCWRFAFALLMVLSTYNPSGYSYFHWVKSVLPAINPYIALCGLALVIGWVVYIRATLRSLGVVGIALVVAVCACILWLLFDLGVLKLENSGPIAWLVLVFQSVILAVGMSWSHIRRRLSGQMDSDDVDEN